MPAEQSNPTLPENTRFHQLYIRLSASRLDVIIFSRHEDNSLIYRSFELTPDENGSILKSLENTVYDNPLLLRDYQNTHIVIESSRFIIAPLQLASDTTLLRKLYEETHSDPLTGNVEIISDDIPHLGCTIALAIDTPLISFLNRAFSRPRIHHHLSPLIRYYSDRRRHGNTTAMFINLRPTALDTIIFSGNSLRTANTIPFRTTDDAVYHILSLRKILMIDDDTDEVLISGERDTRLSVINSLRDFIPYVMPVIFPSAMFRAGKNALEAPFDLIVTPLCE